MKEEGAAETVKSGEVDPGTFKSGEAESFIKERDEFEENQLSKVLHEVSIPALEDQVAQVSEMEEHIINGHIPKRRDCPICQQAQGQ
eukprot:434863-Prorocentrum_lima.AAC.1